MQPSFEFKGYTWYRSSIYGTWMVVSPVSGFKPGFKTEADAVAFIRREAGFREMAWEIQAKKIS